MFNSRFEDALYRAGYRHIAGVDEVGRGCLAGPVVAAACLFHTQPPIECIQDSKALSSDQREQLFPIILDTAYCAVGVVSAQMVDQMNILRASHHAMRLAVRGLPMLPDCLLVDGPYVEVDGVPSVGVFGGDAQSYVIGAASIIAKVTRDRMMRLYAESYPQYGYATHKGYPTKEHKSCLYQWGPSLIQRTSFQYVAHESCSFDTM